MWSDLVKRMQVLQRGVESLSVAAFVFLASAPAYAQVSGLDGLTSKIQDLNDWLVGLGAVLAVTGFVWACLSIMIGLAGAAKAVTVLIVGLCIASAPHIVAFLVG